MDTESFQIGEIEFIKKTQNINKNGGQTGRRSNVNFKIENIKRYVVLSHSFPSNMNII